MMGMNSGTLSLAIVGTAAILLLTMLFWNLVRAERDAAPDDKNIHAKVGFRLAVRGIRFALGAISHASFYASPGRFH